ncbi:hypothetical protein ACRCUN_16325 [Mycobacterium sp. LTG2003]
MVGTPAIAFAEPTIDGGVTASADETAGGSPELTSSTIDTTAASPEPTAAGSAEDSAAAAERNAVEGVDSTVGSGRNPGDPPLAEDGGSTETSAAEQPSATASATDEGSVIADADAESAASDSDPTTEATPETTEADGSGSAPAVQTQSQGTTAVPPDNTPTAPPPGTVPAAAYVMAVPYLALLGLQAVVAPVAHVMAAVTYLLAEVVVVPLLQLQHDLVMLFAIAGVEPVVDSLAQIGVALPPSVQAALEAKFAEPAPGVSPLDAVSAGVAQPEAGLPLESKLPAAPAPPEPGESVLSRVSSFIGDITRKLLESPTLMALAIAALPGLAGLLVLTAGGVRLGYRQAKARVAVQVHGIARFVAMEPVAEVRCGALVLLRPRIRSAPKPVVTAVLDEAA